MNYRKNWFGWFNFFLSAGLISVLLCSFFTLLFSVVVNVDFVSDYSYLFAAFSVLLIYGLFFLLNFIKSRFCIKNINGWKIAGNVFTGLAYGAITGFLFYFAFSRCMGFISGSILFEPNLSCMNIIDALIYNNPIPKCSTLTFSYCLTVSSLFKLFGIDLAVAGIFEVILFVLSTIFIFFTIMNIYGKTPAIICYGFLAVFYTYFNSTMLKNMDSFTLLFFIFSFFSFIFSLVLMARAKGSMKSNSNIILFVLFGAIYGLIVYLDFSLLFIFCAVAYIICTCEVTESAADKCINRRVAPSLCFILTGILTAAGVFALDIYMSGNSLYENLLLIRNRFYLINLFNVLLPTNYLNECIVVLSFCLFGCLGFLTSKNKDKFGSVFFAYIIFVIFSAFSLININVSILSCIFYGLMVGCGIKELLFNSYGRDNADIPYEIVVLEEEENKDKEMPVSEPCTSDPVTSESLISVTASPDAKESEPVQVLIHEEENRSTLVFDKKAMIDNPLPLPKKHVKKSFDYAVEPSADKMDYDIKIKDDDDFDI